MEKKASAEKAVCPVPPRARDLSDRSPGREEEGGREWAKRQR